MSRVNPDRTQAGSAGLAGLQSRHTNMLVPSNLRKVPEARGLCKPHLMQLMVLPAKPVVPKGEPPFFDLYRRPS